jgi:YHS domain-containing protein
MMKRALFWAGLVGTVLGRGAAPRASDADRPAIPAPLAPLEYLIGDWKGTGVPTANPLKGWIETHHWAWAFAGGSPIGLAVTIEGGRTLARGRLAYDPAARRYRLEGTDPAGKPAAFEGVLDPARTALTLDRVGAAPGGGKDRLLLFPNSNRVRYSMWLDHREPGAPQYQRSIQVGVTKQGETFAAGGAAADLPRCILTGGAAALKVTYQGRSYPVCCTGCRDEFYDNPEKYVKKALLRAQAGGRRPASTTSASGSRPVVGKDDGAFDGLVDESQPQPQPQPEPVPGRSQPAPSAKAEPDATVSKPAPTGGKSAAARAAILLRLGQNLEKSGKTAAARTYYRKIVQDFPGTPQAKAAAARLAAGSKP